MLAAICSIVPAAVLKIPSWTKKLNRTQEEGIDGKAVLCYRAANLCQDLYVKWSLLFPPWASGFFKGETLWSLLTADTRDKQQPPLRCSVTPKQQSSEASADTWCLSQWDFLFYVPQVRKKPELLYQPGADLEPYAHPLLRLWSQWEIKELIPVRLVVSTLHISADLSWSHNISNSDDICFSIVILGPRTEPWNQIWVTALVHITIS